MEIPQPDNLTFTSGLSVSPDGRQLAFIAKGADRSSRLWVRSLQTFEARPLADAEGTLMPFWSPDRSFIGYGNMHDSDAPELGGTLYKIEATGGPAVTICDAPGIVGGGFGLAMARLCSAAWNAWNSSDRSCGAGGALSIGLRSLAVTIPVDIFVTKSRVTRSFVHRTLPGRPMALC